MKTSALTNNGSTLISPDMLFWSIIITHSRDAALVRENSQGGVTAQKSIEGFSELLAVYWQVAASVSCFGQHQTHSTWQPL